MERFDFNQGWKYRRLGSDDWQQITLPHDAMLSEPRAADSPGGTNTGWFAARDYEYVKTFYVPSEWEEQEISIEFEGIYHRAELYVNGTLIPAHPNGYFGFRRVLNQCLNYGADNRIRVIAHNSEQPNSRWYSGAGIYRPVSLILLPEKHIIPESIAITTLSHQPPVVQIDFQRSTDHTVLVEIIDGALPLASAEPPDSRVEFNLASAELWSPAHPKMYTARLTCGEDIQEVRFGIRTVEVDAKHGLRINGKRELLLGACIHHDNGILGAMGHPFADRRKIELLKKAGYNAIRSAHNPCSKAILNACDELGMLVLDEYVDMWYIHKTQYDYAGLFEQNWRTDLKLLVEKDRNHPSVIMYSIGNEVSETAQQKGIALTGEMRDYLHSLDNRPVTCGINIFFNYLSSLGFGVYSDEKAKAEAAKAQKAKGKPKRKKAVGSEFINNVAGLLGADFMKLGATLHGSNIKTRDAFAKLDVAGYNYGVFRYKNDLRHYPDRVILGSETFCSDAVAFYDLAQKHPALIGDFAWAGMDYLGEVGIGAWEYKDYAPAFDKGPGWITAGAGTIDLIGNETCQAAYTQVAFELSPVRIGVIPVPYANQKHSPAAWRMTNAVESWAWNGCEGKLTTVEVYARGAAVELQLNGVSLGKKKLPANQQTKFRVAWQPGELTAIVYDKDDREIARTSLHSAGEETQLRLLPEQDVIAQDELCYVRLKYTDKNGLLKPGVRGMTKVSVEGGTLIGLGNACSYNARGYLTDETDTYYGEAMAVIRPNGEETISVKVESPYGECSAQVRCK